MNLEQRTIIEAAEKEGVPACERDARLVVYSMVKATRAAMAKYEVGLNKMTEKQQDAVHGDLEAAYKDLALSIARAMASAGTPSVVMDCKDLKIANGTFTGIVKADQKFFNELISKVQDKSEVVVVLYERQYADALDAIESDKDQRSLPLDGEKPEKKPRASKAKDDKKAIEIAPKMLDDARDFVVIQQNASVAGLQNLLKIGYEKAIAILKILEGEGHVAWVGDDVNGQYELVRQKTAVDKILEESGDAANPENSEPAGGAEPISFDSVDTLTDELYERIKTKVIADQKVSAGGIAISFDCDFGVAEEAVERLEFDGVISEADELGNQEVIQQDA
jgi:DNA segregation ATPase FtsK/SpoIIIE-like protein